MQSRRAALGLLPLTALMLAYTASSLVLIAEPMVLPQAAAASRASRLFLRRRKGGQEQRREDGDNRDHH